MIRRDRADDTPADLERPTIWPTRAQASCPGCGASIDFDLEETDEGGRWQCLLDIRFHVCGGCGCRIDLGCNSFTLASLLAAETAAPGQTVPVDSLAGDRDDMVCVHCKKPIEDAEFYGFTDPRDSNRPIGVNWHKACDDGSMDEDPR